MCRSLRDPRRLGALALAGALVACGTPARTPPAPPASDAATVQEPAMSEPTAFEAVVREFKPNAMRDTYDDGRFVVFHLTRLELTAPARLAGREVRVFHDQDVPPDSAWRQVGAAVRFRAVEAEVVDVEGQVFAGAIHDLQAK